PLAGVDGRTLADSFGRACREPGRPNASPTYTSARAPAHNARGLRVVRWLHVVAGERSARGVARGGSRRLRDGATAKGSGIRVSARAACGASRRDLRGGGVRLAAVSAGVPRRARGVRRRRGSPPGLSEERARALQNRRCRGLPGASRRCRQGGRTQPWSGHEEHDDHHHDHHAASDHDHHRHYVGHHDDIGRSRRAGLGPPLCRESQLPFERRLCARPGSVHSRALAWCQHAECTPERGQGTGLVGSLQWRRLDPYPCRSELGGCDYGRITVAVAAAETAGIPVGSIVPVYQAFGGGTWSDDGGGYYLLPTPSEEQQILATWAALIPTPVFDYAYSWGTQNSDQALE